MTEETTYHPPVSALLTAGDPRHKNTANYLTQYNLTTADIPELRRMLNDNELHWLDGDDPAVWSALHAWRALGQLKAEEAIPDLLALLTNPDFEEEDWIRDEIPDSLAQIGPATLPHLPPLLDDDQHFLFARTGISDTVSRLGQQYPDYRDEAIAILSAQLQKHDTQDPYLNASLIGDLADLKAVEAAALMEEAFAADNVELSLMGDWEEVQIELGLLDERITPIPEGGWLDIPSLKEMRQNLKRILAGNQEEALQAKQETKIKEDEIKEQRRKRQALASKKKSKKAKKKRRKR